jgi:hypothetical protein
VTAPSADQMLPGGRRPRRARQCQIHFCTCASSRASVLDERRQSIGVQLVPWMPLHAQPCRHRASGAIREATPKVDGWKTLSG